MGVTLLCKLSQRFLNKYASFYVSVFLKFGCFLKGVKSIFKTSSKGEISVCFEIVLPFLCVPQTKLNTDAVPLPQIVDIFRGKFCLKGNLLKSKIQLNKNETTELKESELSKM